MAVLLEGGCRVATIREGNPQSEGTLRMWNQIGRHTGAQAISLRTLEFAQGLSQGIRNADCDEVLYVLEGTGRIFISGQAYEIEPAMGIYIKPGETFAVKNPNVAPVVIISSRCPEPDRQSEFVAALTMPANETATPAIAPMIKLSDRKALPTADRWYRVLVDDEVGSLQVTQFVGSIPPGRAPDHFHQYEEVLFILQGQGRMWAGKTNTPIETGACIYLPKGQIHCVENSGDGELRLLGVFYPAGSPAVRYDAE
jgi:mannose-6-phosphate isomerase-like protein (cupin superfamily)